jgi:hypothetical protein
MKTYLISYEIKPGSENGYPLIVDEIKSFGIWWHYLSGVWIIKTDLTAQQIFDKFHKYLDSNINLLIIDVGKDRQGWLMPDAWKWLDENL